MPHMCVRCKKIYSEGTDILNGCPACNGKKFQFVRSDRCDDASLDALKTVSDDDTKEIHNEFIINRAMGVRQPPRKRHHNQISHEYNSSKEPWPKTASASDARSKAGDFKTGSSPVRSLPGNSSRISRPQTISEGSSKDRAPAPQKASFEDTSPDDKNPTNAIVPISNLLAKRQDNAENDSTSLGEAVESIRIREPGTYELNLPSLFTRDELVMSVKDGTYLIDLNTAFRKRDSSRE